MQKQFIMAIDQGTTSSRAVIVNHQGEIVAVAQEEFSQYYPENGWVEHDPLEIWQSVQNVISRVLITSNLQPHQIAAIGITNQRETTVVWDRQSGKPIYPAIVWQSRQTEAISNQLIEAGYEALIQSKTGLKVDPYFSATKIRWILDKVPDAQAKAEAGELCFGTIDTWLIYQLTEGKVFATDVTNAARTMLYNIKTLEWDEELLEIFNIPKVMLPEVKSNSEIFGYTQTYHFYGEQIPIAGVAGDQQAALFGQQAFEPGTVKNTYGTGSFVMMNIGQQMQLSEHNLVTTIAYQLQDNTYYALEGSIFITGAGIQWLRDGLELFEKASDSEALAMQSHERDDLYIVPAFTGMGAPYWNTQARGAIYGIDRGTNRADFAKAMLQAIAYQSRDVVDTMMKDTNLDVTVLKADGGAAKNNYLMQFQADILGIPVRRSVQLETTALGVAYMAGLTVGYWDSLDQLPSWIEQSALLQPKMAEETRQRLFAGWQRAVQSTIQYSE